MDDVRRIMVVVFGSVYTTMTTGVGGRLPLKVHGSTLFRKSGNGAITGLSARWGAPMTGNREHWSLLRLDEARVPCASGIPYQDRIGTGGETEKQDPFTLPL